MLSIIIKTVKQQYKTHKQTTTTHHICKSINYLYINRILSTR